MVKDTQFVVAIPDFNITYMEGGPNHLFVILSTNKKGDLTFHTVIAETPQEAIARLPKGVKALQVHTMVNLIAELQTLGDSRNFGVIQ